MLTVTPSPPSTSTYALGRAASRLLEVPAITPATKLYPHHGVNQQQVIEGAIPFFSSLEPSHWASADCAALIHALLASFSVIIISELGDKTFIITAIMAMKNSRSLVFLASALALFLMTVLAVGMGVAATVIPKLYTHVASIILFLCFGLKMLKEAYDMDEESEESEFDEVKRSLEQNEDTSKEKLDERSVDEVNLQKINATKAESAKENSDSTATKSGLFPSITETIYVAPVIVKVFTMIFVAEWGDRSQISTVILAAREDVYGVFVGSFLGHVLCTGLAVIGGRFAADMISVRTMTLLGGIVFLFFATLAIVSGP